MPGTGEALSGFEEDDFGACLLSSERQESRVVKGLEPDTRFTWQPRRSGDLG